MAWGAVDTRSSSRSSSRWVVGGGATVLVWWWNRSDEVWLEDGAPKADSTTWVLSTALASSAAILVAVALCIGPIRSLRTGRRAPRHVPIRRTVGLWAGAFAAFHLVLALEIHTPGWRLWHPYVTGRPTTSDPFPIRTDPFALAYWVGSAAAVLMSVLVVTSNRWSMRRLGAARWKRLQQLAYVLGAVVVVHVWYVQSFEDRATVPRVAIWVLVAAVVAVRLVAAWATRTRAVGGDVGVPAERRA